ncbi:uncharacterized protein N7511_005306 [Penicillium nucicola]|uniref:uncharacterized protein n=1 Tax=Penicillium nucicola TaxID=1850975 RepID=UPI0025455441|nr:uncharacterized protein N7511_005306 [Penicillium nucicola]KAJ5761924.1 hypothetical protein N7511_005306 [Penicillium nucicola]
MERKSIFINVHNGQDGEHYPEPIDDMWWVAVCTPGRMEDPSVRMNRDRELLEYVIECIVNGDCFIADEPLHHTTGGWICMPVPIREGQERKHIYQDAEDLAEFFTQQISSRKMRVDREALWHSHPAFDMEDSLLAHTQIILPGEDASKVPKYPICFGDVCPPRSADITSLTSQLQTMEVSDPNAEIANLVYSARTIASRARSCDANSEAIVEASIRFEEMINSFEDSHFQDKDTEAYLAEIRSSYSTLSNLLEDGCVTSQEMQDAIPITAHTLENITDSFNNMQVDGPVVTRAHIPHHFYH